MTAYFPVIWNVSAGRHITHEIVFDSVVQEIDIPTGLVLFQWDSLDHVPLADSYQPAPSDGSRNPFDYFHIDSIQLDDDGNLLISSRNTWAVYKLDHRTGAVLPAVRKASRGVELALDIRHRTARLVTQWRHAPPLLAEFEGNVQQLPNRDHVIGWGQQPYLTEYGRRGRPLLDPRFVGDTSTIARTGFCGRARQRFHPPSLRPTRPKGQHCS